MSKDKQKNENEINANTFQENSNAVSINAIDLNSNAVNAGIDMNYFNAFQENSNAVSINAIDLNGNNTLGININSNAIIGSILSNSSGAVEGNAVTIKIMDGATVTLCGSSLSNDRGTASSNSDTGIVIDVSHCSASHQFIFILEGGVLKAGTKIVTDSQSEPLILISDLQGPATISFNNIRQIEVYQNDNINNLFLSNENDITFDMANENNANNNNTALGGENNSNESTNVEELN